MFTWLQLAASWNTDNMLGDTFFAHDLSFDPSPSSGLDKFVISSKNA